MFRTDFGAILRLSRRPGDVIRFTDAAGNLTGLSPAGCHAVPGFIYLVPLNVAYPLSLIELRVCAVRPVGETEG
jgi:hypothetical protein